MNLRFNIPGNARLEEKEKEGGRMNVAGDACPVARSGKLENFTAVDVTRWRSSSTIRFSARERETTNSAPIARSKSEIYPRHCTPLDDTFTYDNSISDRKHQPAERSLP